MTTCVPMKPQTDRDIYDGAGWTEMDIEDLKSALAFGRSIENAAEFLCRAGSVEDVARKAEELGLKPQGRLMLVYCAKNCETIVEAEVIDLGAGAGRVRCLECGGDGDWSKFAPDMMPAGMKCLDCKGSGYQFVSV
jgi:hypothetical protein